MEDIFVQCSTGCLQIFAEITGNILVIFLFFLSVACFITELHDFL